MAIGDDRAMMPREGCLLRQNQSPKIAKWDREERGFIEAKSVSRNEIYTHMS